MEKHTEWQRQIEAEIEGELSLADRAVLARHLASCAHCAGARASHLELRAALASASGDPHARVVPKHDIGRRGVAIAVILALAIGLTGGWLVHRYWSAPGAGSLEGSRAAIVAP